MFEDIKSIADPDGCTRAVYSPEGGPVTNVEFHLRPQLSRVPSRGVQVVSRMFGERFSIQRAEQHLPFRVVTM
jgi:hypothetical protein